MPGVFGSAECPRTGLERLRAEYRSAWGEDACEEVVSGTTTLGGHAFGDARATHTTTRYHVAIDGDVGAYSAVHRWGRGEEEPVVTMSGGFLELHPRLTGNAAAVDRESGVLYLTRDWAGSFPFYYVEWRGGLLFASLLRPLARAVAPDLDELGLLQFLRQGYVFGDRTPFRSIRRLRPGEVLRFEPDGGRLATEDRSELWVGSSIQEEDDPARLCLEHLERSLRSSLDEAGRPALMMSGGWDSRTLLAVCDTRGSSDACAPLLGYSHGDVESRELRLVRRLCGDVGVPCHLEPIDGRVLEVSALRDDFARTGTAVFPHWHRSGRVLAERDRDAAMAGIFGEVLGGHYGRTMAASGLEKAISLLKQSRPDPGGRPDGDPVDVAFEILQVTGIQSGDHWYLDPEVERSIADKEERINVDIRRVLRRFRRRGVEDPDRLIEATISEHRGSQYIAGQTVSLRTAVNVFLPFADRSLLHTASRTAPHLKVHNAVNRKILRWTEDSLLDYPMAATLLPASYSILMQEASRLARKVIEALGWRCHFVARGMVPSPRWGWVNFEFLRRTSALEGLADSLESELWNVGAIRSQLRRVRRGEYRRRLHPLFDQLGKVYTIDRLVA